MIGTQKPHQVLLPVVFCTQSLLVPSGRCPARGVPPDGRVTASDVLTHEYTESLMSFLDNPAALHSAEDMCLLVQLATGIQRASVPVWDDDPAPLQHMHGLFGLATAQGEFLLPRASDASGSSSAGQASIVKVLPGGHISECIFFATVIRPVVAIVEDLTADITGSPLEAHPDYGLISPCVLV